MNDIQRYIKALTCIEYENSDSTVLPVLERELCINRFVCVVSPYGNKKCLGVQMLVNNDGYSWHCGNSDSLRWRTT